MCGFAGFINCRLGSLLRDPWEELEDMASAVAHRGPDDSGIWYDSEGRIGFAHRRLSIIDRSPDGHQPMLSASGRYAIVYNGEIYNFRGIQDELEKADKAPPWRGYSDTEVLLAAIESWGICGALERVSGMFAFALWDRNERVLYLARDRMGEKPLYYGWQNGVFLFGSELKALSRCSLWNGEIDRQALGCFFSHGYIMSPLSIYRDIKKLPAGTYIKMQIDSAGGIRDSWPEPQHYWTLRDAVLEGQRMSFDGGVDDAVDELEVLLRDVVRGQMVSDVPLGAFLSGGIDSSLVVALMQSLSSQPVRTFSIGFDEITYDETAYAGRIARHLGTEHVEFCVSPEEAINVIPQLPSLYDEPFSDSSQIPTYLVSKLARGSVTVSLSGDGADELFGGYDRYRFAGAVWKKVAPIPFAFRRTLGAGLTVTPSWLHEVFFSWARPLIPEHGRGFKLSDKLKKFGEVLKRSKNFDAFYHGVLSYWNPEEVVEGKIVDMTPFYTSTSKEIGLKEYEGRLMYDDAMSYLPDDILVKLDRAAMGVSLETRVPMLDHRVVEFAWRLPLAMKMRQGQGKWILRRVLDRYVPREMFERPKQGFGVPIAAWLKGPLREWAGDLLNERRLRQEGLLRIAPIMKRWKEHLSGRRNWQGSLWNVLMFQSWLRSR